MSNHSPLTTALILAGGENSRFFPFNTTTHKGALSLFGKPLVVQTIEELNKAGFEKVIIVVSPKDMHHSNLRSLVENQDFSLEIVWVEQVEAKGMGDATLLAAAHLPERFLITFPYQIDIASVLDRCVSAQEPELLFSSTTQEPWLYGILEIANHKAISVVEKPEPGQEPSNHKLEAVYVLSQRFLEILKKTPQADYAFEESLNTLMQQHPIAVVQQPAELLTEKYPWHLFGIQHYLFGTAKSEQSVDAKIAKTAILDESHGPVVVEAGATIGDFAKIVGPAYIGRNAMVGDYSFVRQSSIEESAVVGANTEIVRSIIFPRATIHFGYLADSILGQDVTIGGGFLSANKRHDRENIQIEVKGKKVNIGRNNCGVLIGDRTKVGVRTTTMPGVVIGADSVLYPCLTIYDRIEHGQVVKHV